MALCQVHVKRCDNSAVQMRSLRQGPATAADGKRPAGGKRPLQFYLALPSIVFGDTIPLLASASER